MFTFLSFSLSLSLYLCLSPSPAPWVLSSVSKGWLVCLGCRAPVCLSRASTRPWGSTALSDNSRAHFNDQLDQNGTQTRSEEFLTLSGSYILCDDLEVPSIKILVPKVNRGQRLSLFPHPPLPWCCLPSPNTKMVTTSSFSWVELLQKGRVPQTCHTAPSWDCHWPSTGMGTEIRGGASDLWSASPLRLLLKTTAHSFSVTLTPVIQMLD